MKKSQNIILSAVLLAAISSCDNKKQDEWTDGKDQYGHTRDTSIYRDGQYHYYRYYGLGWYLLSRNNMINTGAYMPASASEISARSFTPRAAAGRVRGGGFGRSAHFSSGS